MTAERFGRVTESLEAEAGRRGRGRVARAPWCRADHAGRAMHGCRLFPAQSRTRVPSPKNKGFCHAAACPVEFSWQQVQAETKTVWHVVCSIARLRPSRSSCDIASVTDYFRWSFRVSFCGDGLCFCYSIRGEQARAGGKPASRVPTQQSTAKTRVTENSIMEQRLAMKIRSRLRVICATPVQKRSV
jgi:hypothetical protein